MITWHCQSFSELSTHTLYDLLKLRCDVFVVEQNCPFPELDGLDPLADTRHLYALQDNKVIAYARLLAKGDCYSSHCSIGRVVVAEKHRKAQIGHVLISKAIQQAFSLWPNTDIKIGAQSRLENFYKSHGFLTCSAPYMEDDIEHYLMTLTYPTDT
ncbi:GNAT family N-acetyltransferase [Marinomonas transparens]|uniref:GNAT family N-acetyltransferase n=1 Tax=Marinomonas transparens TaxID=2795388 RepID=A0A934JWI8_9GAMM|nr:GNAT family N-acetyltransferase [Marinomonas transparens]MBJ7539676.1 GNAT family N-acetyltransferase [Marinomonas transparens]